MPASAEHSNEPSGSINGIEFLESLRDFQLPLRTLFHVEFGLCLPMLYTGQRALAFLDWRQVDCGDNDENSVHLDSLY